jgi:plastocyanin
MRFILGLPLLVVATFVAGCTSDSSTDNDSNGGSTRVSGEINEWSVLVDTASVPAGEVTFTIANTGTIDHEFLVVKTDLPDGAIPIEGDRFPEDLVSITVIDEIEEYAAGTTETLTVTLDAGKYQLVCNLPAHYQLGMHTTFVVE